ncbi:EAL domain-containing protein [Erythrobacter sp. SCSIO 43205]|uniref:putative bifunctional diguanylate cyclase/phosphodiesterase n=1 Tax=Erythrobacter sp. SCSIO 43205 TaxID=2779361 RepID=UPI001CAA1C15|nr:EAL domain-containing protein [Erythrobacter sp. SCSIO 43205]UAB79458.1 EAL domain-containing protein [Erythrobacter sp. SCSIO 43205]
MSDQHSLPTPPIEQELPVSAVLGLSEKGQADWPRLRGLETQELSRLTFHRLYVHAIVGLFVAHMYMAVVGPVWVGLWLLTLAIVQITGMQADKRHHARASGTGAISRARTGKLAKSNHHSLTAIASAVLWAVPLAVFAPFGSVESAVTLMVIIATLMAARVFFYTTTPLNMVIASLINGAAGCVPFVIMSQWEIVTGVVLFTICTMLGAIEVGRAHMEARIAENAIIEKEEVVSLLLREFEENEADWLWEIDTRRRLQSVSPRFAFALDATDKEVEGKPLLALIAGDKWESGDFPPSLHELAEKLRNRENFSNLTVQVSIKGEERWWELSGTPIRDERGKFTGFRGVGSDVTEQRQSSEKIKYLARYDTLTSLPNRLMLTEALGDALEYAQHWRTRCALMMIDLDRFKAVNDSLGHITGDKLLAQVSSRLQALTGENAVVGRLGGDEFAVVIRDASNLNYLRGLASRVIETLSEPYHVDNHTLYVGASVGSAIGPRDGRTVEELMRNADLALYRAKDAGGGEHCRFEPVLHASAEERRQLESSLRKALGLDEFVLHYQPVVDARSEAIVSFEALVRWNSSEHGFVSPGKFIPLAEDTRLIVPIGQWVLRQACFEARTWPDHVKVNVNVSPEQLLEPNFHQEVVDTLAASGLRPERLEIEVTESIFLRDASVARNALEQVMALGCSIALDDFGTGYSSLGYLRKLRFSTIKVDRTFVQGASQGANESLAIINAVVAMAKSLDMTTTAEGVESAEEAELIRNLGCDKIQGFYFGRPMASEDARGLFTRDGLPDPRRLRA